MSIVSPQFAASHSLSQARTVVLSARGLKLAARLAVGLMTVAIALPLATAAPRKSAKAVLPWPSPPAMQLGDAVKPLAYEAELTVVPTQERFSGHLVIHVEIAKPTEFFWLNAKRLDIRSANLVANGKTFVAKPVAGGSEFVGLRFALQVPAGRAVITLDYDGAIDRTETAGIFKQPDGESWYAFTQFEATDARRAFPCFDEPQWKTPWHLTLIVPASDIAASNTPIAGEEPVTAAPVVEVRARKRAAAPSPSSPAAAPAIPMKRVRFAPTPPLPTYLIAFAVGPFDVVDGGKAGKKGTPLRYLVPRGRANEAGYAKEATPKLLELLEDYFGQPYPFEKLDAVAIPISVAFGAMENVGLITYEMPLLLAGPEQDGERFRREYAQTAAHEMAHQWFGDLVTMQWWNDVWLHESFATWMAPKIVDRFYPAWQLRLAGDERRQEAIAIDRLATTRQVRQPVNSLDDLGNAFDAISYEKGAAVLGMFENAIGEERFRNGVRRYLSEHAHGNARSEDFFRAIATEAGAENAATISGIRSFIEQPGVPRLAVSLDCGPDGKALPKLVVMQSRYLPARQAIDQSAAPSATPSATQRWSFPACFQFGRGGDFNETCALIQEPRTIIPLPSGERCPQWVLSNRGGAGYFVSSLTPELTQQLVRTPLLPSEAIPALHDAATLTASGEWPADLALELSTRFASHRQLPVAEAAADLAAVIRPSWLEGAAEREGFARYAQKHFGARARALGWTAKAGDHDGDAIQRQSLVPWVADMGNDAGLQKDATRLAREWLAAKAPFPVGARSALLTATRFAQGPSGRELLDACLEALRRVTSGDRRDVLAALGSFRDPALAESAWDTLYAEQADAREGMSAMRLGAANDEAAAVLAVRYLRGHYDAIVKRLPEHAAAWFPRLGAALCDSTQKAEFEATLGDKASRVPGGARNYAQGIEEIGICIAARQSQRATLKSYLSKQ